MLTPLEQLLKQPNDIELRAYYESLRQWLVNEQNTWVPQWTDLARFMLPRNQRFNYSDVDNGQRADWSIIDNTATMGLRTLAAGLLSGMSSPTREWFKIRMEDPALNEQDEVKAWLADAEDVVRRTMIKSNIYQTLFTAYREEGLYGTTAFAVLEDPIDDVRCYPYPMGSYYLSGDASLRIDFCMRVLNMTVRQIVDRFGYENASSTVQEYYNSNAGGQKDQWWPVVHVVHKNNYFDNKLASQYLPWVSVYYEMNTFNTQQGLLSKSGFNEFPIIAGRWDVTGENFYGNSPGMDCLGDTMSLQLLQKRKQQAIDKQVNPPMVASTSLLGTKLTTLPGDVTFADTREGKPAFQPAFQVQYDLQGCLQDIKEHQNRINNALYTNLFLMLASSDRREITAEEIRAKQEEKMMVLGPVLERNNDEVLRPLVLRIINILFRRGKLPPLPQALKGKPFKVEFASILAQVQKMLEIANIDKLMAFLGNEFAVDQGIMDSVDLDETARTYAKLLNVPPKILRNPDQVAAIRADRNAQQKQAQDAENAQKLAVAGQTLANTDLRSGTALDRILSTAGQTQ